MSSVLMYKCRACGASFNSADPRTAAQALESRLRYNQLVRIHRCGEMQSGLADLLGAREVANV